MKATIETIVLGMGCFWGAEKRMSAIPGVLDVESGYANGEIEGRYEAILGHEQRLRRGLSTLRNHAEVVKVTFDPRRVDLETILARFWESHDPTQGDRQGNDIGSNYRSAIYTTSVVQQAVATKTRECYQQALSRSGYGQITTEIAALENYFRAEEAHQDYLEKNPHGYCGLGGTGVSYPAATTASTAPQANRRIVVFLRDDCADCRRFRLDILDNWQSPLPVLTITDGTVPDDVVLQTPVSTVPTVVLLENSGEVSRFTGYAGQPQQFWQWLGSTLLTPEQQRIAFHQGTEPPFTGAHLHENRAGRFVDPLTGTPLFRSEAKFDSGCGWPSFFSPVDGALTQHEDNSHGMHRVEIRSASSGIHLGHVFEDGPPPTGQRYCINGNVLHFEPDEP